MIFLAITFFLLFILCILLAIQPSLLQPLLSWHPLPHAKLTDSRRPSLGTTETKITQDIAPYQFPPLRPKSSSRMAMGLKRLDASNWLTLDSSYLPEHSLRLSLLESRHADVIQCLPGSQASCHEVLDLVTSFLASRFPQHYSLRTTASEPCIESHLTGEVYPIGEKCENPLEVAARLAMEDFNVLIKNQETREYHLMASATLFPAGWKLQERIGYSMARLHGPVPAWKEKLGGSVNRYFDHLSSKTAMERTNLFIQTTTELFQNAPEDPLARALTAKDLMVRRERQTFVRLEKTDAVLFTVRTYMQSMTGLGNEEIRALRSQILGWEEEVRLYKGFAIWGEVLMKWCEEMVGGVQREAEVKDKE
ncbi:uncharacterized protein LY89DRAFT_771352 [Mollisia scopiformis]|uniref:Uncharacterized protein n=1 Tax=Mollisia scopiformis TaxID=149040 RepID=A0A194XK15_MOLSC|nr:uncharacterized protein LY89DRAFT_771352 [Mollisia scopiformis]KUJ20449.1 hypothetical protein LY89DRAFT_771352 [Mollisia scopiformis]